MSIDYDGTVANVALTLTTKGTPLELAESIDLARRAIAELQGFISDATTEIANQVPPGDPIVAEDGTTWRVKRKRSKPKWDDDALTPVILARARDERIVTEDGEYEDVGEAAVRVIRRCAGIAYWRKTELSKMGIDPDEYLTTEKGALYVEREEP